MVYDVFIRILSAWFYRGHSPNLDFFQVRPWFKEIKEGKRPKVIFQEYIEMVEYQNIQTRMKTYYKHLTNLSKQPQTQ
jgi:hypothetical protein